MEYNSQFYQPLNAEFEDFRDECLINSIKLITKDTEIALKFLLEVVNPKKILEIGSATGYSSIFMNKVSGASVDTIEYDESTANVCNENIDKYKADVKCYVGDSLQVLDGELSGKMYDFVFIDGDKNQYIDDFNKALEHCHNGSIIVVDDSMIFYRYQNITKKFKGPLPFCFPAGTTFCISFSISTVRNKRFSY